MANDNIRITVDPEDVKAKGRDILNTKAPNYEQAFKDMYKAVEDLEQAGNWKGTDYGSYQQQIEGFREDLNKMFNLMKDYGTYLINAAETYEKAQEAIASDAKKLQN